MKYHLGCLAFYHLGCLAFYQLSVVLGSSKVTSRFRWVDFIVAPIQCSDELGKYSPEEIDPLLRTHLLLWNRSEDVERYCDAAYATIFRGEGCS